MIASTKSTSASTTPFLDAVEGRRSYYNLLPTSPIPDTRIQDLVNFTIKHAPSTYNVQSARAVLLLGDAHRKLWDDIVLPNMKPVMPAEKWAHFEPRIKGFAGSYGTVVFFEDQVALDGLSAKNAMIKPMLPEFSMHSQGLHHFLLWTALEAEGLGANLQHFNFLPAISQGIKDTWGLPESWTVHAQLVFGAPGAEPFEKSFESVEERVRVFN